MAHYQERGGSSSNASDILTENVCSIFRGDFNLRFSEILGCYTSSILCPWRQRHTDPFCCIYIYIFFLSFFFNSVSIVTNKNYIFIKNKTIKCISIKHTQAHTRKTKNKDTQTLYRHLKIKKLNNRKVKHATMTLV